MWHLPILVASLLPARVGEAPRIDGRVDDRVWATVPASDEFRQTFPSDGAPPSEPTRFRIAYDDANLYVAIECDQRAPAVARLTRRDREVAGDRVSIDIDTGHDRRNAFHFQISAGGVLVDALRFDDTERSSEWDEIWQGEVARGPHGWSAELRIPLRILRVRADVMTWGLQVRRWIGATGEIVEWAYEPRDVGGEVSRYGELGPFESLEPRGSIVLVPFALSRAISGDGGSDVTAGLDLAWRPHRSIALAAAVLPDFAQVEADQKILNLSTTEIELPEKRPFFLHGLDVFATPLQLLYTRRIGEDGAPILGAAKLLAGARGIEVGALSAITGATMEAPGASHHVARARFTRDRLVLGSLATARVRDGARHDAFTGGIDAAWRSASGEWAASGQLAGTRIEGGEPRLRPDGTQLAGGDTGAGGIVRLAREGGTLRGEVAYERFSRDFAIDDLGYLPRANLEHGWLDLEAYTARPYGPFVESRARLELFWRRNLDGLALPSGYQWNVGGTTNRMWSVFLEVHWRPAIFDDREFGDGRALQRAGKLGFELEARSDTRRAVVGELSVYLASVRDGHTAAIDGELEIRPRDNIELAVEPELLVTRGEPRFLADDPAGPRLARQNATSFGITARATWTLTRDLTLQAYAQALLATIRYRDAFTADPADRVIALSELAPATFDPAMYDGREGALDATLVARWEYAPGSVAFLVYTHAQTPAMGADFEPRALVAGPASDAVMFKLSWAWSR